MLVASYSKSQENSEGQKEIVALPIRKIKQTDLPSRQHRVKFWLGPVLGQGAFGKVCQAIEVHTGRLLAVKTISLQHADETA